MKTLIRPTPAPHRRLNVNVKALIIQTALFALLALLGLFESGKFKLDYKDDCREVHVALEK